MRLIKTAVYGVCKTAKKIRAQANKPYLVTVADIIWCAIRYGASPNNYYKFDFYKIGHDLRKTYVTHRISRRLIRKYNQKAYCAVFEDKAQFARKFADRFRRDFMEFPGDGEEAYRRFTEGRTRFICKPLGGAQGQGIAIVDGRVPTFRELADNLKGDYILEAYIDQHEALDQYYDKAINCIRVVTICKDGKVTPIVANITYSTGHKVANASFGGITCLVDVQTGEVTTPGGAYGHILSDTHPCTGIPLQGFVIPHWNDVLEMVDDLARRIPQVGYVGWDIAISKDGPVVIEGNTSPGYTFFQIPQLLPGQVGTIEKYKPFL